MYKVSKFTVLYMFLLSNVVLGAWWPLNTTDELSSAFGPRNMGTSNDPSSPDYDYDFHGGIDIGGSSVKAIESRWNLQILFSFKTFMVVNYFG